MEVTKLDIIDMGDVEESRRILIIKYIKSINVVELLNSED